MGDSLNGLQTVFGLSLTTDVDDSGTPIVDGSDEKICKSFNNVTLIASDGSQASRNLGAGAAFVTTRRLVWVKSGHHSEGYVAHFRQIIVHAISRDGGDTGAPCVFVQLEEPSEYDDREGEETGTSPVLYMVPAQAEDVGPMYDAMCESALLNPDPVEDDEGEFFFSEDEVAAGAAASLSQLDNAIHMPSAEDFDELVGDDPGRFEDDEDEHDTPN